MEAKDKKNNHDYTEAVQIIKTAILKSQYKAAKPVNEELAKLFIRLDLMEQTGYGIPLVTKRYGKAIFEFLDFFLRVTIPFEFELEDDSQNEGINLTDTEMKIYNLINVKKQISSGQLILETGLSHATIERSVKKLAECSLIQRIGAKKNGHWEVIE